MPQWFVRFGNGVRWWPIMKKHWQDRCNLVLGLWVFLSPWVLQHTMATGAWAARSTLSSPAMWNLYIVGIGVVAFAMAALVTFREWEEWANMVLGFWLYVSPWVLGFSYSALLMWNAVIVGALVVILAGWTIAPSRGGPRHA